MNCFQDTPHLRRILLQNEWLASQKSRNQPTKEDVPLNNSARLDNKTVGEKKTQHALHLKLNKCFAPELKEGLLRLQHLWAKAIEILQLCDHKTCRVCSHHGRNGFSHCTKSIPVQSHNSFLDQRSRKVIVWFHRNHFCTVWEPCPAIAIEIRWRVQTALSGSCNTKVSITRPHWKCCAESVSKPQLHEGNPLCSILSDTASSKSGS